MSEADNDIGGGESYRDAIGAGVGLATTFLTGKGVALIGAGFSIVSLVEALEEEEGEMLEKDSASGPGEKAWNTYSARCENDNGWRKEEDIEEDWKYQTQIGPYTYAAGTTFQYQIPVEDGIPDEINLPISVKNEMGMWSSSGDAISEWDGAEASVEIPIRNAEPEIEDIDTDDDHYTTSESGGTDLVQPELMVDLENQAKCDDAMYDLYAYVDDEENIAPDELDYTHETFWHRNRESVTIAIDLGDFGIDYGESGELWIMVLIEARDKYGGWELESDEIKIEVEDDSDGGDGGGGSIPPGGPHPTSTEYLFSLERSEYEEYLEEGQIAPELLEALREEGIDDLDREAELSPAEEGWLIQQDSEQRYWIEVTEEELRVYDI